MRVKPAFAAALISGLIAVGIIAGLILTSGSDNDPNVLEEGANINRALTAMKNGRGPKVTSDPPAAYGMTGLYSEALVAINSTTRFGESQLWKLDRPVYLYLFEGEINDGLPDASGIDDWAQVIIIIDAETGEQFNHTSLREPVRLDVSRFESVRVLDSEMGVAAREANISRTPPVPVERATPALRDTLSD